MITTTHARCVSCGHHFRTDDADRRGGYLVCPQCAGSRFTSANEIPDETEGAPRGAILISDAGTWVAECAACSWPGARGTDEGRIEYSVRLHNSEHHLDAPHQEWAEVARWATEQRGLAVGG